MCKRQNCADGKPSGAASVLPAAGRTRKHERVWRAPGRVGPLAEGRHDIFNNEKLTAIAEKHNKTIAQIVLRWHTQRGVVIIPKSTHKERIEENLNIWDFSLSEENISVIGQLDLGHSEIIDHNSAATAKGQSLSDRPFCVSTAKNRDIFVLRMCGQSFCQATSLPIRVKVSARVIGAFTRRVLSS